MTSSVSWVFEVAVKAGETDNLRKLITEMAERAEANEPDTLTFEWTISADGATAQVHERYPHSHAALTHLESFNQNFADRLMALVEPQRMTVYGNPDEALRRELAGADPVFMESAGGFTR